MNLDTTYLGLNLRSPLVPSASPLTKASGSLQRMEDAGAAAVVLHSIFEEQIRDCNGAEGLDAYVKRIEEAKCALSIPIIASLNGTSFGGWTTFSRRLEQAGADALELNLYSVPTDPDLSGEEIEDHYLSIVAAVKAQVKIPVAMKLSPFFTNLAHFARRLDRLGVNGLVLFNRFYQPDIELESNCVVPDIHLSTAEAMRLPLRWIAILHGRVGCSLAATGGIHCGTDAIKMLMAGADVTMLCSVLLANGIERMWAIEREMREWMHEHGYESIEQLKGCMSEEHVTDPSTFERVHYIEGLMSYADHEH